MIIAHYDLMCPPIRVVHSCGTPRIPFRLKTLRVSKFICFPLENPTFVLSRCCKQGNKYWNGEIGYLLDVTFAHCGSSLTDLQLMLLHENRFAVDDNGLCSDAISSSFSRLPRYFRGIFINNSIVVLTNILIFADMSGCETISSCESRIDEAFCSWRWLNETFRRMWNHFQRHVRIIFNCKLSFYVIVSTRCWCRKCLRGLFPI